DEFDEEAVEVYLEGRAREEKAPAGPSLACGCPSTHLQTFVDIAPLGQADKPAGEADDASTLSHWPVQIRLIPPTAPFLKGADLLIAADCVPVAYPRFHRDFLKKKAVMVGCPKFDDVEEYIKRFEDLFRSAGVKSVTVLTMEVPCCSALPAIVKKGMEAAGTHVPLKEVVISSRGKVLN
ncbi:MAG: 4Fe-4S ferredoxin, partial [Deltaproteobacteria bacterium]|nr:4Fe-4S ferredoxin [Deltaproteobacteria bacterium]